MKTIPDINPDSQDIAELQAMVRQLMSEKQTLLEQFKLAIDRQFAKRSEALKPYNDAQGDLFNEVEVEASKEEEAEEVVTTTTTTKKIRGKRKLLPKDLPRERIVLDLDDDKKVCSCCQQPLHKIGEDISEKLEFTPAVLKVIEYVRPKYGCRHCEKEAESVTIHQKPVPASIIPKSFATESLLTNIILGKYQYALPLYRQESLFQQSGIELSRTTMARWVMTVSEHFTPLYRALKKHLLQQIVVHADETPLNVLKEEKQSYMWVYCSGADSPEVTLDGMKNIVLFDYQNSRARACPETLYKWLTSSKVVESTPLGKAIKYTVNQWPKLVRYVEDGHLPIDNNRAERAIKSMVIGRKNWLFANTPKGADASAMLYSIIETAKANGLILYEYLVQCMKELAKPVPDIDSLLPWNFSH